MINYNFSKEPSSLTTYTDGQGKEHNMTNGAYLAYKDAVLTRNIERGREHERLRPRYKELRDAGYTQVQIMHEMGLAAGTVDRLAKWYNMNKVDNSMKGTVGSIHVTKFTEHGRTK